MWSDAKKLAALKRHCERLICRIDDLEVARAIQTHITQPREIGVVRRASLDMTRALADYRSNRETVGGE